MADILKLSRLIDGVNRNVDISTNTPVVLSLKVGGSVSNTELTKAILDNLVALQDGTDFSDGTNSHTHDGRYYTETEIGETGATSGADLVGVNNTPTNYSASSQTVQDHLEGIDTALASAGGTVFADDVFRIQDNGDATKELSFELSGITTGTLRTITMSDNDVDLGDIATNSTDIADLTTLSGVAANDTDLGTFTGSVIPDSQTIKQALQSLETYGENTRSLINNFEWQDSALDYITDNTLAPPTEVSGDRYVLSHDGGAPNADWDGASAGDIVEFDGSVWTAVTPTLGTFVAVDDEADVLYYWGGSSWSTKAFESTTASTGLTKVGFDIQLADAAAASGIAVSSGAISISLATDPGLEFSSGSLRVLVDPAGALERVTAGLDVADGGIDEVRLAATSVTAAKLGADVAGDGLQGGNGSAIAVDASEIAGSGLEDDGSENLRIATSAYDGDTITGGGGSAAAVQHSPQTRNAEVVGESLTSGLKAFRYGIDTLDTPETAGRVYLADPTELSLVKTGGNQDPFHVIGLAVATGSETAGDDIDLVKNGLLTATSHGLTIGQPCYLDDNGAVTSTPPSTSGEASVKLGVPKDANTIDVNIQIMGVN